MVSLKLAQQIFCVKERKPRIIHFKIQKTMLNSIDMILQNNEHLNKRQTPVIKLSRGKTIFPYAKDILSRSSNDKEVLLWEAYTNVKVSKPFKHIIGNACITKMWDTISRSSVES